MGLSIALISCGKEKPADVSTRRLYLYEASFLTLERSRGREEVSFC
jgi:hypothetical protein